METFINASNIQPQIMQNTMHISINNFIFKHLSEKNVT